MAAPNPRPQPARRPKTDEEIRAEAQRLMHDPRLQAIRKEALASRAKGKSVRLEDLRRELNG